MTQIDFYVLTQTTAIARLHYACRLAEKAVRQGHHITIVLDDKHQAQTLSDYLWSFKPESFLPHLLQDALVQGSLLPSASVSGASLKNETDPSSTQSLSNHKGRQAPIALLWGDDNESYHDILINLGQQVPAGFSRYQRTCEIVVQEEDCLKITRSHFQFYRERGYPLKSHTVG